MQKFKFTITANKEWAKEVFARLDAEYPDAECSLDHTNPLELMVATILSAQCTDARVNKITPALFNAFKTPMDYADKTIDELKKCIQSCGFYHNKAKNIQACCAKLIERHDGEVPQTMEELVDLNGVGRKTANVVLGNAFNINHGVVVDTHVARLSTLLRLTREKTPEKIEKDLMKLVPREDWTIFSHWLIWHGRRRCPARRPDCAGCEIRELCPSAQG